MVYVHHSKDIKERALYLLDQGRPIDEVAATLGVDIRSIYRWANNYDDYGSVVRPPNPNQGRPLRLNADTRHDLLEAVSECPENHLSEFQEWLITTHDVFISISQLHHILNEMGTTYKRLRRVAAERDEEERAEWRLVNQEQFSARQMVWVDETSKDDRIIYRKYGRALSGERATIPANFVRGQRYSLVASLGLGGYTAVRVVEGSVDGAEFVDFILTEVVPTMNPYPGERSILIMDNCAIHKSNALQEIIEAMGILLVYLPPYSPDLNPIEESFSALKAYIRTHWQQAIVAEDPKIFLLEATAAITPEKSQGWIRHAGYRL